MRRGLVASLLVVLVVAGGAFAATVATGGSAHKVVKGYRKKVQANTKRLKRR